MFSIIYHIVSLHRYRLCGFGFLLVLLLVAVGLPGAATLSAQDAQPLPTAAACEPPTAFARGGANVRGGPDPGYPLLEQLLSGDVRRVTGRHAGFQWWQVEAAGGRVGWVWNGAVVVTGNIRDLPLVEAPPLNGVVPETAAVWEPPLGEICAPAGIPVAPPPVATPQPAAVAWQAEDAGWQPPLNLSNAGTAARPQLLVFGDDLLVFWEDTVDGFTYTWRQGGSWPAPRQAEFPFATRRYYPELRSDQPAPRFTPTLLAGPGDAVHAFWLDDAGILYHSHVASAAFGDFEAWSEREELAASVAGLGAAADSTGAVYLAYLQNDAAGAAPSGVYVLRLDAGALQWSAPQPLHQSGYYRLVGAGTANLQVSAGEGTVAVAWDEAPQERIWLARSADRGRSWPEMQQLDRRLAEDGSAAASPGNARLLVDGGQIHVTWQAGHEGAACSQVHQWSDDNGQSWQRPARLPAAGPGSGCLADVTLDGSGDAVYLLGSSESSTYLTLWTGTEWSAPQRQGPLQAFTIEETGRQVSLSCGRDAAVQDGQLVVAACGVGAGQDIWLLSRDLQEYTALLAVTPVWSTPAPVSAVAAEPAAAARAFASPQLVAGADGRLHAFWSEGAAGTVPGQLGYAVWQNGAWSRPQSLFAASGPKLAQPAAVLTREGRLVLLWSGGNAGEIFFSWAAAARAMVASEWTEPAPLPAPVSAGSAPALAADPSSGALYAAYAIPLNEARGVYLASSANGESWSDAALVFDAAAAGWARVDQPRLAVAGPGELHLLFWKRGLPDNAPAAELHYARSLDGGATWSEPEAIHNGTPNRGVVVWSDLAVAGGRLVHLAWQEWDPSTGARTLWHRLSEDGGLTWNLAARIGGFGQEMGPAVLLQDPAGSPYLLALTSQTSAAAVGATEPQLAQWQWSEEGQRWEEAESLPLRAPAPDAGQALAASITGDGDLVALLVSESESGAPQLVSAARAVSLPSVLPTPLPTLTPTPQPSASPSPTPLPQPTPTLVFSTGAGSSSGPLSFLPDLGGNALITGAILALIPAALLVVLAVVVFSRVRAGRR